MKKQNIGWALERLNVQPLWAMGLSGEGIRIGHLDSGVDSRHPALEGRVAAFQKFDRNGYAVAGLAPYDSGVHGTQTAGLICGAPQGGHPIGIAPRATLCSGVVIEGGNVLARVLMGMDWMLDAGVRALSMPLGIPGCSPLFSTMIAALRQHSILPVLPIGNTVAGQSHAPGNYAGVLSVGASDDTDRVARFSGSLNINDGLECLKPDIVAPGVDVLSLAPNGGIEIVSGTSMASAYVAGVASLLFQARPEATVGEVEAALIQTAVPVHETQSHRSRYGLINPKAALQYLQSNDGAAITSSPSDVAYPQAANSTRPYFDKRLTDQLNYLRDDALIEAIVVFAPPGEAHCGDLNRYMHQIIEQVGQRLGGRPRKASFLPRARIAFVAAEKSSIQALIQHEAVIIASAPDIAMN